MSVLVLDIETVGQDIDTLHEEARASLLRSALREPTEEQRAQATARVIDQMSLWPLAGRIVAIATVEADSLSGRVYYESPREERLDSDEGSLFGHDERHNLSAFWDEVRRHDRVVTFNGRAFDLPYLMLRSAVHGLRPSRNLMAPRHLDLLEAFTFQGATRRHTLAFYCHAFGIASPKADGVSGGDVARLHAEGRHTDIARYCLRDARATAELYRRYRDTLSFEDSNAEDVP